MPGRGIVRSLIASLSVLSLACASNTVNSTTPAPAAAQGAAAKPGGDKPAAISSKKVLALCGFEKAFTADYHTGDLVRRSGTAAH